MGNGPSAAERKSEHGEVWRALEHQHAELFQTLRSAIAQPGTASLLTSKCRLYSGPHTLIYCDGPAHDVHIFRCDATCTHRCYVRLIMLTAQTLAKQDDSLFIKTIQAILKTPWDRIMEDREWAPVREAARQLDRAPEK